MVMRRRRAWADTRFAGSNLAASGTNKTDLLADLSPTETKTVTRLVGHLHLFATVTSEIEYEIAVDVGVGVVSKEAFDLETLPDAFVTSDYPQQGWVYVANRACYQSLSGGGVWRADAIFDFDIRSQRKVDRGVLFMVISNTTVLTGATIDIHGRVRALCLT